MFRILLLFLYINFSLVGCGYNPIYVKNENSNFSITKIEFTGDREVNNYIKSKLVRYKNNNEPNKYELEINSSFEKIAISKDKTGKITKNSLIIALIVTVFYDGKEKNISLSESFKLDENNDNFEQLKYENEIKNNLSDLLISKLITNLVNIK